jgi:hypothetical protein
MWWMYCFMFSFYFAIICRYRWSMRRSYSWNFCR